MITPTEIEQWIRDAARPPSNLPDDEWCEKHYEIQRGAGKGRPQFDSLPMARIILKYLNRTLTAWVVRLVCMVSAQSIKTETVMMALCRRIAERPVDTMWATATQGSSQDFTVKALYSSFETCAPVAQFLPPRRSNKLIVFLNGMRLMMRGSESRIGLQGDPVGFVVCDERREWQPGAIDLIRKRTRTFPDALEVSMGVAGEEFDELHRDFNDGSQTFLHWNCPKCKHSQPFRFGQDSTSLYPDERKRGGVVWPNNETTCPNGKWIYDEVEKATEYECENCGAHFKNHQKLDLLQTMHEFHRNPDALKQGMVSLHYNALYMPWESCSFGKIAVEFLRAQAARKVGDIEPLKTFVTETLGEPWQLRNRKKAEGEVLNRVGDYEAGQFWMDIENPEKKHRDTATFLTFDRQKECIKYIVRQWCVNQWSGGPDNVVHHKGESRLIMFGEVPGFAELRALQLSLRIPSSTHLRAKRDGELLITGNVAGDDGGRHTQDFRQACIKYGWVPMKGERFDHYDASYKNDRGETIKFRRGWRTTEFDIGVGTIAQYNATIAALLHSSYWFKEKLFLHFVQGRGPLWEVFKNVPIEYVKEMSADVLMEEKQADGSIKKYFAEVDKNDAGDCEGLQLVLADYHGITRYLPHEEKA